MSCLRLAAFSLGLAFSLPSQAKSADFTLARLLDYPYPSELVAAQDGEHIAWVVKQRGVRNVWIADGPDFEPRRLTHFDADDGQEITQLVFSPKGDMLAFVRGGDHDANWLAEHAPDPAAGTEEPRVVLWATRLPDGKPFEIGEGDAPAISAQGRLAYLSKGQAWTAPLAPKSDKAEDKPKRLFFDRGKTSELHWSPDGRRLAFVSERDDHAFVGLYSDDATPLLYLAPSTGFDRMPRWSPDGERLAFVRRPGRGGEPEPILRRTAQPWSIWTADATSGEGRVVWHSPETLEGSYPETAGEANLLWMAGDRLAFLADLDGWPHLYSIAAHGGTPLLLTPGTFMVEHVAPSRDRRHLVYDANAGGSAGDRDRRHLFMVPVDRAAPVALTPGGDLQWSPVATGGKRIAFIDAGAKRPPSVALVDDGARGLRRLQDDLVPNDFPADALVVPKAVSFRADDGVTAYGQLFQRAGASKQPGVIFVHGGPPRQMLLGWHYMDYYANAYAVNQYLASRGVTVLSVNYRLGIGYGHAFHHPPQWGPTGAAEYQDVVAGARFLQSTPGVDARRIGIWGGSYGGYLTALALARDPQIFKAGVDMHGVHDWSRFIDEDFGKAESRYEKGDREEAMKIAFRSSPVADLSRWKAPVLLVHGDDDRNVPFRETVDLARRLQRRGVAFEELVLPGEIHGFLRHASWLKVDQATADFLVKHLRDTNP